MMIPLSLSLNIDAPGNRFIIVAEAQCFKVPKKIADAHERMGGGDYWYLHRLWVHPDYRRKGHATQLMHDLVKLTDNRGVSLVLKVNPLSRRPSRTMLQKFYKSFGFKPVRGGVGLMERI